MNPFGKKLIVKPEKEVLNLKEYPALKQKFVDLVLDRIKDIEKVEFEETFEKGF